MSQHISFPVLFGKRKEVLCLGRKVVKYSKCEKNTPRNFSPLLKKINTGTNYILLLRLHQGRTRLYVFLFRKKLNTQNSCLQLYAPHKIGLNEGQCQFFFFLQNHIILPNNYFRLFLIWKHKDMSSKLPANHLARQMRTLVYLYGP